MPEIAVLIKAGKATPASLGQSVGMAGLNIGKVVADINGATKNYEGMKMPVIISYDVKTKDYKIIVNLPPTSQLILKAAGIEKAAKPDDKAPVGNVTIKQLIDIVNKKSASFKDLKTGLLQVIGSCLSMGVTVEGKNAKEMQKEVKEGKFDSQIK